MAVDEELAMKLRERLEPLQGFSEKKMFGGICFMLNGHMVGAASGRKDSARRFLFRIGKENDAAAAQLGAAEPMMQGGRKMRGFYFVDAETLSDDAFDEWLSIAIENAYSLPPKN
ncbi:TfoX/Sxy family protein [Martelella alba]|uniref:TfoX/Sxy family protein n=1 Tax=Martelella alba TaxID=2590451 RepID=A0A506UBV8_9HYPH|nr:TfoX/Sxy family protein [Martelella alba]TPW30474.1 TfoX/Sxy family protein [Martelella alba]